jgi:LCP family protein required for cell wall assembly
MKAAQPADRSTAIKIGLVVFFIAIAAVTGYFSYRFVRGLVGSWTLTDLPGFQVSAVQTTATPGGPDATAPAEAPAVAAVPAAATPEPWDGASRVSLLIMGLDYRDWQPGELQGPPRTDTMILLSLDPVSRTAGILSIPRDLWVNIPGFGYARINSAYQVGEGNRLPGGGPQLAMDTVEALLGIPIDYYAQIDFDAFVRFIDEISGVEIDVPEKIKVDIIGDGRETIKNIKPGRQVLTGELALAYARNRYTEGGDFDRAQRQQQVIFAIRDRLTDPKLFPQLLQKAPTLYNDLSSGVNTNLGFDQALRLGMLAVQIPEENIKRGIIGTEHVNFAKTPDGTQDVLKPLPEKIRILRDEIFTTEGALSPSAGNGDMLEMAKAENARISVANGTLTGGLAGRTAEYLRGLGLNVPEELVGDGEANFYTTIIDHTGNPYTLAYLVDTMGISANKIYIRYEPGNPTDVELILGNDWANNNPMP